MKTERRIMFILLSILMLTLLLSLLIVAYMESNPLMREIPQIALPGEVNKLTGEQALNSALYNLNNNQLPQAEALLLSAVRNHPGQLDLWMLLGSVFFRQEKYQQAEQTFRNVLRHQPNNPAAYNNLSETLFKLKRFAEAETYVNKALALAPHNSVILLNAASLYAVMQNDLKALFFLREAMKYGVTPENVGTRPELVHLLERPDFMNYFIQRKKEKKQDKTP